MHSVYNDKSLFAKCNPGLQLKKCSQSAIGLRLKIYLRRAIGLQLQICLQSAIGLQLQIFDWSVIGLQPQTCVCKAHSICSKKERKKERLKGLLQALCSVNMLHVRWLVGERHCADGWSLMSGCAERYPADRGRGGVTSPLLALPRAAEPGGRCAASRDLVWRCCNLRHLHPHCRSLLQGVSVFVCVWGGGEAAL